MTNKIMVNLLCCQHHRLHLMLCVFASNSVVSDSLWPHVLEPARLLYPQNSLGKNTGVSSHSLLQGIFPTQGSNLALLHYRQILHHWATREAHHFVIYLMLHRLLFFICHIFIIQSKLQIECLTSWYYLL